MSDRVPGVYLAILKAAEAIGKAGISKDHQNDQQKYRFRGIDDVLNSLSPILVSCGLCVLPNVVEHSKTEYQSKNGGTIFNVVLKVEFRIVCAMDGSVHTVTMYGEAMDSADKATNKAASAAYKYMAIQTFCIPTEGDNDADATTPEIAKRNNAPASKATKEFSDEEIAAKARALPSDIRSALSVNYSKQAAIDLCVKHGWKADDIREQLRIDQDKSNQASAGEGSQIEPGANG